MSANCWAPTLSTNLLYSFILSSCKVSASWKQKRFTLSKLHQSINDLQVWKVSNWIMKGCWTVDMIKMHFSINFRCSSYWTVSNLLLKAKYVKKWEFSFLFIHSFECKRRVGKFFLFTRTGPFLQSCKDGYRWHLASKIFILHIQVYLHPCSGQMLNIVLQFHRKFCDRFKNQVKTTSKKLQYMKGTRYSRHKAINQRAPSGKTECITMRRKIRTERVTWLSSAS